MTSFSDELWTSAEWIYQEILAHPFITGLTDGSLPAEAFRHFIVQDAELSATESARMREHFVTTSRYEWMFWDAGYRQESWPMAPPST